MPKKTDKKLDIEVAETPVEALDLSERVFNSLKRTGIITVGDVLDLLEKGDTAIISIRNFGEKSLDRLRQKMVERGYLKDETTSTEEASILTIEDYIRNITSTGTQIGDTIDDFDHKYKEIGEIVDEANIKNEIDALKDTTSKLSSLFYKYLRNNLEVVTSAMEARAIPRIEQRITNLEEAFERKRNWGLNIWLLVITILSVLFGCVSAIAAVWALFLR